MKNNLKSNKNSGFVLAAAILSMLVALIIIPVLFNVTDQDAKWTVQQKHSSISMELVQAGMDRAMWKLKETNDNWYHILTTGPLTGYNDDLDYTDVNTEGVYRVRIGSDPTNINRLTITVNAKNTEGTTYRAAQAYAQRTQVQAALHGYNLFAASSTVGRFTVHWGPIYDTGNLTLSNTDNNQLYPQKYAAGSILVYNSTGQYSTRDDSPDTPNKDDKEWFSYQTLPPIVTPDFDYYRDIANTNGTYWTNTKTLKAGDINSAPGQVYFFDEDATLKNANKFIQGIVIAKKDLTLKGWNNGVSATYANDYSTMPASQAWLQYQENAPIRKDQTGVNAYGDTNLQDEYPGDGGLSTLKTFTFGSTAGGASGVKPSVSGFVYVGGNLYGNDKTQVIHGAMSLSQNSVIGTGVWVEIFYDDKISSSATVDPYGLFPLRTASSEIYFDEWEEIIPTPF